MKTQIKFRAAAPPARLFHRDDRGIAATEFALILPLILMIYLGMVEISSTLQVSRRANLVAHALSDLTAAQTADDSGANVGAAALSEADIQNIFGATTPLLAPLSTTNLKMTISEVAITSPSAGTWKANTVWTITKNGGTARPCSQLTPSDVAPVSLTTLPTSFTQVTNGANPVTGTIIVADVILTYKPIVNFQAFKWNAAPTFTFQRSSYSASRNSVGHIQYWMTSGTNCQAPTH